MRERGAYYRMEVELIGGSTMSIEIKIPRDTRLTSQDAALLSRLIKVIEDIAKTEGFEVDDG